ncbi:MAG: GLUG motif-containing protein [bacterium]
MSNLSPLSTDTLQRTINTTQQQIDNLLKTLETGLSVNSSSDDPANLYISSRLNAQSLDASTAAANAQSGLSYLQLVQQAYDDIYTELDKIKTIANGALTGVYTSSQRQAFQDSISESVNKIKYIEESTMFNGMKVFDNSQSAGLVNEHMFAITSKSLSTVTTVTIVTTVTGGGGDRGYDYQSYLINSIDRYGKVGGILTNGVTTFTIGADVITISSAAELISALDNKGAATAGKTYFLLENIHLTSLGMQTHSLLRGNFEGRFEGNGYAIMGFSMASTVNNNGLFETLETGSQVNDLVLKNFSLTVTGGGKSTGALAGLSKGTVNNTAALNVDIEGDFSGGLIGVNNGGGIYFSYSTGSVGITSNAVVGGLVAQNMSNGAVHNNFSTANVVGMTKIGGLVGENDSGTVKNSYATGTVSGDDNVGGLVGLNQSQISYAYSTGAVRGKHESTGGLVGANIGAITETYSISEVTLGAYPTASRFHEIATGETIVGPWAGPAGYTFITTLTLSGHGTVRGAFASAADAYSAYLFSIGASSGAKPIENCYLTSIVPTDPKTWTGYFLQYGNGLVGNGGADPDSFYGVTHAPNTSYFSEYGIYILGAAQMSGNTDPPLDTWSGAYWDFTGSRPLLNSMPAEGAKNFPESSLPDLPGGGGLTYSYTYNYSYTTVDKYGTTSLTLNVALNNYTNTVAVGARPGGVDAYGRANITSATFATNKLISKIIVSNAANPNEIFTEGEDFSIYSNDNGANWKIDFLSNAMYSKNIKIDYEGVPTGTANQSTSGFNLYLGDSKNFNVKDMVLDLGGRLNFNITRNGAQSVLDAVNQTMSYMDIKDIRVSGSITLATNSLNNKKAKATAISFGSKSLISADEAKQAALLAKKQINLEMANDALKQFYSTQLSIAQTLMNSSNSGYGYTGQDSNSGFLYSPINSNNKAVQDYYYKNLYELEQENQQ